MKKHIWQSRGSYTVDETGMIYTQARECSLCGVVANRVTDEKGISLKGKKFPKNSTCHSRVTKSR